MLTSGVSRQYLLIPAADPEPPGDPRHLHDRFVYALGIPNVGTKTARDLAEAFEDIEKLKSAKAEELTAHSYRW